MYHYIINVQLQSMKLVYVKHWLLFLIIVATSNYLFSQAAPPRIIAGIPVNYSEDSVGTYTLPDPLLLLSGEKVKDAATWSKKRRPELVQLFEENQFGKMPPPPGMSFNVFDKGTPVFDGKAIRKQVTIYFTKDTSTHKMDLLIYIPAKATKPSPILLNVSFSANSLAVNDAGIKQGEIWNREGKKVPASQGASFGKLNVENLIAQNIGVATVYYGDIEPDFKAGIQYGIRSVYLKPGQTYPAANEWGAISAWAWGLSRAMDYFEKDAQVDAKRVALFGVSRLGKTVLWAGVHDTRFAMVIASCSGEGGAAISRRNYGETVKHITDTSRYFYQFAPNYHNYGDRVNSLPVDGHLLVALMAPRPLLLQTGDEDFWSDPRGEFLAAVAAEPVYNLFNEKGPGTKNLPQAGDSTLLNPLGYFMHKGGHGTVPGDWNVFIEYIKKYL